MCGIAGYFGTRALEPSRIDACLKLMGHRGPDNAGVRRWSNLENRNCYLLHTRLSIIDFDARANQPFRVGSKWMAYNGELYNYVEIKEQLRRGGTVFTTTSDTEVLLLALGEWGWGALDRMEGMWAFAHYDEADGSFALCRDRFGEKPLYLLRDETGLYFGSETRFLRALSGRPLTVNRDHLCRYLVNGYKALYKKPSTFFEEIEELPRASLLRVAADGKESCDSYWRPAFEIDDSISYDDAVFGVRERLIRAVELRLRADVPAAFCMSGGIDSNALISIARKIFNYDLAGFTIVNSDARYDESEIIDAAVHQQDIRHTTVPVETTDFLSRLRRLVRHHDAPVYTITYYAHWRLMEAIASAGFRISVSGTAADELFSGYYDHHLAYLHDVRNDDALLDRSRRAWEEKVKPFVRNPYLSDPDLFLRDPDFRGHIFLGADAFSGYLKKPWSEEFREKRFTTGLLRNRMLNEIFHENVPVILHEDDLNAMSFSVENRSPYLDRGLFEYCNRIPTRHLVQGGLAKALLRDAMRGIVPDCVLDSPRKVGFNAPIYSFLDVSAPDVRAYLLDDGPVYDLVRRDAIESLIQKRALPNSESKFLFNFLCSKIFLEIQCA